MNKQLALFKLVLGCKPKGRNTEQHDVFFCIGEDIADFSAALHRFWPQVKGKIHIDTWQRITAVGDYDIEIIPRKLKQETDEKLFFVNLGWYRSGHDREEHESIFVVAANPVQAKERAKQTPVFKKLQTEGVRTGNAATHIDDRFEADDIFDVERNIPKRVFRKYAIRVVKRGGGAVPAPDELHITGFLPINKL